ncbi:MAG: DNA replication/repair protein RecF [Dermatophilaceae bacterium]
MRLRHLEVVDFRSYAAAELPLEPGVTTFLGRNGQGKTNLVEAVGYLATLSSHRVATDAPLVRFGAPQAVVRGVVVRHGRESLVELEVNPGRMNRARLNKSALARPRDVLGTMRAVVFAPEDLALVKGDPGERRRYLDDLLVARQPRWAGVRADYDKIVRQRSALLKSAGALLGRQRRAGSGSPIRSQAATHESTKDVDGEGHSALHTLDVWDSHLAHVGSQLLYARLRLLRDLAPYLGSSYAQVSAGQSQVRAVYKSSLRAETAARLGDGEVLEPDELAAEMLTSLAEVRAREVDRGVCLVGPHRDDLLLTLGEFPAKGYASHGESWSVALGLRLAGFHLLRHDLGDDPVLVLDDVFAELDTGRRERLAMMVADCEQVLVTAAVPADVPDALVGRTATVTLGAVALDG